MNTTWSFLLKVITLSCLIFSINCTLGALFTVYGEPTTANLKCIAQKGFSRASIFAASTISGVGRAVAEKLLMVRNAGMEADVVLKPCRIRNPVD